MKHLRINKYLGSFVYAFTVLLLLSSTFLISNVFAKGGDFHIETITANGFGRGDEIMDFNNAYQFGGYLYVTTDSWGSSPGLVYRSQSGNADDWSLAATAGFGDESNLAVDAMIEFDSNLYITTANENGAEIWRSANGTSWTAVVGGGAATTNGFGDTENTIIRQTGSFDNYLWAFTDNDVDGVEVWRSLNGTDWSQLEDDPGNPGHELPNFDEPTDAYVQKAFSYNSRLYIYCYDNNDAESSADDIELWYTEGGVTPVWIQVEGTFLNIISGSDMLWFKQHSGILYVGNDGSPGQIWSSLNGTDYILVNTFIDSSYVFPASTTKGLLAAVGYTVDDSDRLDIYRYSGGSWIDTGISFTDMGYFILDAMQFGNYYYAWGGWSGVLLRVDLRPTTSASSSAQTQLGDGVVEILFTAGDISDADTLRAKVEYDIGGGYQKATLSEDSSNVSASYGVVSVENDNEYQVGNASGWITTSSGANTVTVKWLSKIDEGNANTANANIRVTVTDGVTTGVQKIENTVIVDNVAPDMTNLNLIDGQTVSGNPFVIKTKATDSAAGIWKIEFYVDDNLLCTDSVADADGYYTCDWDTATYHSAVRLLAYDMVGNTDEQVLNAYVGLPDSGELIINFQILGLLVICVPLIDYLRRKLYLSSI